MAIKQHTSKGISQALQYEIATLMNISFKLDIAEFEAFDPELNLDYSAKISNQLAIVCDIDADYMLEALQMEATLKVVDTSKIALSMIKKLKYYIEKTFPDDSFILNQFGFAELPKVRKSQIKLMMFLKNFAKTTIIYKDQLIAKGLTLEFVDDIEKIAADFEQANIDQDQAKKKRYLTTGQRVKAYNDLWKLISGVAKAGKLIYENNPDKLRDYILDRSPKKKTVKHDGKEINTAVLQGIISDAQTNQIIEDAIIEIDNTNHKTTTNENGEFFIENIIPGTYSIKLLAFGHEEYHQSNLVLASGNQSQKFNFSMQKLE